jgi:hypothetical protein
MKRMTGEIEAGILRVMMASLEEGQACGQVGEIPTLLTGLIVLKAALVDFGDTSDLEIFDSSHGSPFQVGSRLRLDGGDWHPFAGLMV